MTNCRLNGYELRLLRKKNEGKKKKKESSFSGLCSLICVFESWVLGLRFRGSSFRAKK